MELVEDKLTINKAFAAKYQKKKEAEELSKLRDRHGEDESESSSESEDELGAWSEQAESEFLRTLSLLKNKDPRIYDQDITFFTQDPADVAPSSSSSSKPVFLSDYQRQRLLERGEAAELSDSDSEPRPLTYTEEQDELKAQFKLAAEISDEPLLKLRAKTSEETAAEERDYNEWLQSNRDNPDLECLRSYWGDPGLDKKEQFLRDYILGQGHRDDSQLTVPTYEELVSDDRDMATVQLTTASDSEDEDALDRQEDFERKYNFRFEEPDSEFIKSYPRTISSSVRTTDDSRKTARQLRQERKRQEAEKEKEELRRLKNLKQKEVEKRLNKLSEITGNSIDGLRTNLEDELEGEFDPEAYDEKMKALFGDEYYEQEDDSKPQVVDDELWNEDLHCEDPEFNMDADFDPTPLQDSAELSTSEKAVTDFTDLVKEGTFKYRTVQANDFGLSTEEILSCENRELNSWVSLSKMVQYRPAEAEQRDRRVYRKRRRDINRKRRCLPSLFTTDQEAGQPSVAEAGSSKKRKKNKKTEQPTSVKLSKSRLKSYGI